MKNKNIKNTALGAVFAALIFTAAMIHIPLPGSQGYIHLGDSLIYLAASMLPFPYAAAAAAVGGALSDLLSGYAVWIPFTAVIKILNVIPFSIIKRRSKRKISAEIAACVVSGVITCAMYFISSRIIYGSFAASAANLPGDAVQAAAGGIIYLVLSSIPAIRNIISKDDKNG